MTAKKTLDKLLLGPTQDKNAINRRDEAVVLIPR